MGVFECSKSFDKVVHDISLGLTLTSSVASSFLLSLLLLLTQRGAGLHGHERCAERLEPRRDATQRLALSPLLLVFTCTEVSLAASGVRSDRRAAVGLCVENVGLEGEWVDKLVGGSRRAYDTRRNRSDKFGEQAICVRRTTTHICVYALWERVDTRWELYL